MKKFKVKWQGINAKVVNTTIVTAKNRDLALVKLGVANRNNDVRKIISIEVEVTKKDLKTMAQGL